MPQLAVLALVGAGLYAGYRWVARTLQAEAAAAQRQAEEMLRRASEAARIPKDLGTLEWDEQAQVYRPAKHR
jgi:hypothetical protein